MGPARKRFSNPGRSHAVRRERARKPNKSLDRHQQPDTLRLHSKQNQMATRIECVHRIASSGMSAAVRRREATQNWTLLRKKTGSEESSSYAASSAVTRRLLKGVEHMRAGLVYFLR